MTIDWTLPVETTEDPPRPVRVLCTDAGEQYPIVALISREPILFTKDGHEWPDGCGITLRNVVPPKPEPVLREAWVVFKEAPNCWVFTDYAHAKNCADANGFPMARAAVMSDGSPVPGEGVGDPIKELIRWKQECKDWKAKAEALNRDLDSRIAECGSAWEKCEEYRAKAEALQAEVDRMKPVVDAASDPEWNAWRWENDEITPYMTNLVIRLLDSVRAYQSQQAPAEPVKNCTTCRWNRTSEPACETCEPLRYSNWEPRHD